MNDNIAEGATGLVARDNSSQPASSHLQEEAKHDIQKLGQMVSCLSKYIRQATKHIHHLQAVELKDKDS